MKKTIILLFSILTFYSCDDSRKVLLEGVTYVELNVRATPDPSWDGNIIDELVPGDLVSIMSFNEKPDRDGIYWCEIRLDRTKLYKGEEINYAWVAYRVKDLPYVVDKESWNKIEMMYEMENERDYNEILTGSKTWLTQSIYDYVYPERLKDIKYHYDNTNYEDDRSVSDYDRERPTHSVDYTDEDRYTQYCRTRITTSSADRDETALYAVIFNQTPRTIHFFRLDSRINRGQYVKQQDFGNSFNSNIKSIERKTKKSSIYYKDYYGYKTKLQTNYDAIRIRPHNSRDRFIIYNAADYTSSNMQEAYFRWVEEY
tara:strand:- start:67011 stop:67952 length:942 start_codon:yes stop_codon:yes gene_type:complete